MPRDQHNPDGTVTLTLSLAELQAIENWGDCAADIEAFDGEEQQTYDRISGLRMELEVAKGVSS